MLHAPSVRSELNRGISQILCKLQNDNIILIFFEGAESHTYDEARLLIDAYIKFYNNERIQLKTKLTPLEKRCQFVA